VLVSVLRYTEGCGGSPFAGRYLKVHLEDGGVSKLFDEAQGQPSGFLYSGGM
jgi:hypothetical protein